MWWRSLWAQCIGAIVGGFSLALAAMGFHDYFWPGTGWYMTGYYDTYPPFWENEAVKLAPAEEQRVLNEMYSKLREQPNSELNRLRSFDDVCTLGVIDCLGLTSERVRRVVEGILSDRQMTLSVDATVAAQKSAQSSDRANHIASFSLGIAFISLFFSILTFFRRPKVEKVPVLRTG